MGYLCPRSTTCAHGHQTAPNFDPALKESKQMTPALVSTYWVYVGTHWVTHSDTLGFIPTKPLTTKQEIPCDSVRPIRSIIIKAKLLLQALWNLVTAVCYFTQTFHLTTAKQVYVFTAAAYGAVAYLNLRQNDQA